MKRSNFRELFVCVRFSYSHQQRGWYSWGRMIKIERREDSHSSATNGVYVCFRSLVVFFSFNIYDVHQSSNSLPLFIQGLSDGGDSFNKRKRSALNVGKSKQKEMRPTLWSVPHPSRRSWRRKKIVASRSFLYVCLSILHIYTTPLMYLRVCVCVCVRACVGVPCMFVYLAICISSVKFGSRSNFVVYVQGFDVRGHSSQCFRYT